MVTRSQAFAVSDGVPLALPDAGAIATPFTELQAAEAAARHLAELLLARARYQNVIRGLQQAIDGDAVTAGRELELLPPMDGTTEPDLLRWSAVVPARVGREDAAREMLGELVATAPKCLEAARRFAQAGLMPPDVIERFVPEAV